MTYLKTLKHSPAASHTGSWRNNCTGTQPAGKAAVTDAGSLEGI